MTRRLSLTALVLAALLAVPAFACAQIQMPQYAVPQYVFSPTIGVNPAYLYNRPAYELPGASPIDYPAARQAMVMSTLNAQPGAYLSIQPSWIICEGGDQCWGCNGNQQCSGLTDSSSISVGRIRQVPATIGQLNPQPQGLIWNAPYQVAIVPYGGVTQSDVMGFGIQPGVPAYDLSQQSIAGVDFPIRQAAVGYPQYSLVHQPYYIAPSAVALPTFPVCLCRKTPQGPANCICNK